MSQKIENKLDEIKSDIYEIKLDLREHMARTAQNEEMIQIIKQELDEEKKLSDPVRRAYIGAKWSISAILVLATIAGTIFKFL